MEKDKKYKPETVAIHSGREPEKNFGVVNPPVYHASTILFETYEEFCQAEAGRLQGPTYGRHGTPSHRLFEAVLAELEGADKCLLTCSGLNAITITLTALLKPGDHLLIADSVYSPTRFFCEQELTRWGVEVEFYDPLLGDKIKTRFKKNTRVVYCESPGSLTFEIQDIPAIAKAAHEKDIVVVLDNTWATPLFFQAFAKGADVSIHSATKYIGGHSDLMMGVINTREKLYPALKRAYKNFGITVGPNDLYLAQRGLRSLPVRLKHQQAAALELATWLKKQPAVSRVLHPALPDCPGHEIWKRDYTGASGLFSFILRKHLSEKQTAQFVESLSLFKMGYSWGGYESLLIPLRAEKIRSAVKWQPEGSGFRVFVGLENIADLQVDLAAGLAAANH